MLFCYVKNGESEYFFLVINYYSTFIVKKRKLRLMRNIIIILLVASVTPLLGQSGGEGVYNFLKLPTSARVSGLGGAPVSLIDNDMNLVDAIVESLSSGPKSIKDILSSINYKSNSPNFRSIVQQTFTRHSVAFGRNGSVKANSEGPVSKTGDRGMFVRIGRGAYAVYSDGMTAQDVKSMSDNWVASHSG